MEYTPKRPKLGENTVFKLFLKEYATFLKLHIMVFRSFIRLIVSLNVDILCSIYCGEKSKRFTPLALSEWMNREDISENWVNISCRISWGVMLRYIYLARMTHAPHEIHTPTDWTHIWYCLSRHPRCSGSGHISSNRFRYPWCSLPVQPWKPR